jgi:hypothetical protein
MVNALFIHVALFATPSRRVMMTQLQAASLSSLLGESGNELSGDTLQRKLMSKRVALDFAAGRCPMYTSFEPALDQFRKEAAEKEIPIELVYVSSDRTEADQTKRAARL